MGLERCLQSSLSLSFFEFELLGLLPLEEDEDDEETMESERETLAMREDILRVNDSPLRYAQVLCTTHITCSTFSSQTGRFGSILRSGPSLQPDPFLYIIFGNMGD